MKRKKLFTVNCHLCGKNSYKVLIQSTLLDSDFSHDIIKSELKNTLADYKKHSRIVKCNYCGLVYTNPMENPLSLIEGYEDVIDEEYLLTEKYRKILLTQHLQNIEMFKKNGKILDIGCFAGYFLELAKERKWEAYGIEPSKWARELAKKRKVKIISKSIENAKLPKDYYDAITMWDVIEHLPNPKEVLHKCYESLNKEGIIALGTPNIECLVAKIMGSNYPYILRMHHVLYSPKTLNTLLEQIGFRALKVYSYGRTFPISYIMDRLRINNPLYNMGKSIIKASPKIANHTIHLNIGDSFVIIAKKQITG